VPGNLRLEAWKLGEKNARLENVETPLPPPPATQVNVKIKELPEEVVS
jgi:hypothetical protein